MLIVYHNKDLCGWGMGSTSILKIQFLIFVGKLPLMPWEHMNHLGEYESSPCADKTTGNVTNVYVVVPGRNQTLLRCVFHRFTCREASWYVRVVQAK